MIVRATFLTRGEEVAWEREVAYIVAPAPVKVKSALRKYFGHIEIRDLKAVRGPWRLPLMEHPLDALVHVIET